MVDLAPFVTPRPAEYAPIPKPLKRRDLRGRSIPSGPRNPLLTLQFQKDTPGFLRSARDRYGDCVSFYLGGQLFIGAFSPEMVNEVTVSNLSKAWALIGCAKSSARGYLPTRSLFTFVIAA
jgi:hypothetical protein